MNLRQRMLDQTADLPSVADITPPPSVTAPAGARPRTPVGTTAALAEARLRIAELESQGTAATIRLDRIIRNRWQPRIRFDQAELQELADNIRAIGLMQPVLVRRIPGTEGDDARFELIAGERRWRAHQINESGDIKALIVDVSDQDMGVFALAENINREDLTDYEIGKSLTRLQHEFPDRASMLEALGLARSSLYRYLAFSQLPDFMLSDLEKRPEIFGGNAASDTLTVLKKHGARAQEMAKEFWAQLWAGSLDQMKFAPLLDAALTRGVAEQPSPTNLHSGREIRKLYAQGAQAGSITKDAVSFTIKLKSAVVTAPQEERIRALIRELFEESPKK